MANPHPDADGFVDDADPSQPRIVITIDGGLALSAGERVLRDYMVGDFVDELVNAIRGFYDARKMMGPPKHAIDADKLAAIATTEASMK